MNKYIINKIGKISASEIDNKSYFFGMNCSISDDYILVSNMGNINKVYLYKNKNNKWLLETIIDLSTFDNISLEEDKQNTPVSNFTIINGYIFKKQKINIIISSLQNNIPNIHIFEYSDNLQLTSKIVLNSSYSYSQNISSVCISDIYASFILNKTFSNNSIDVYNTIVLFIYQLQTNKWIKIKEISNYLFTDSISLYDNNLIVGYNFLTNTMMSIACIYNLMNINVEPFQLVPNNYKIIKRSTNVSISKYTAIVSIEMNTYNKDTGSIIIFTYTDRKWNQTNVLYSNCNYDSIMSIIYNNYIITRELIHDKNTNTFNIIISLYNKIKNYEKRVIDQTYYQDDSWSLIHTINQNSCITDHTLYLFGISMSISNNTFILGVPNIYLLLCKDEDRDKCNENGYVSIYNIERNYEVKIFKNRSN